MANKYKDEEGHFTTKENEGGPCHHNGGNSGGVEKRKDQIARKLAYGTELTDDDLAFVKENGMTSEEDLFDDDYDLEFDELDKMIKNAKNNGQSAQQALDTVSYDADIEPGTEEFNNLKEKVKKEFGLEEAIKNADDDVLDEQFGKDTPERKLVGAIKEEPDFDQEKYDRFTKSAGKFIESQGSDQDLDEMISDMRKDFSDEEIIKKLAMMFKGTIK